MSFREEYDEYQNKITRLGNELKEFNKKHANRIAGKMDEIMDMEGVIGCRILEIGSPECRLDREIGIYVKLTEGAKKPNQRRIEGEEKYFSFYHSDIPVKIQDVIGEEFKDTTGVHISDNWRLGEPSYWEELIAGKEN